MKSEENLHLAWLCVVAFCNGGTLAGANLFRAKLYKAKLVRANLSGADFYGADFTRAKLTGACLCFTDFTGAKLIGADIASTNLSGTNFYGADISGADFTGANIVGTNFSGTIIGALYKGLSGTNLNRADFKFKLEFELVNQLELENKRDQLMNNQIHKFKQWYMISLSSRTSYTFYFEDENDALMAKMILK